MHSQIIAMTARVITVKTDSAVLMQTEDIRLNIDHIGVR